MNSWRDSGYCFSIPKAYFMWLGATTAYPSNYIYSSLGFVQCRFVRHRLQTSIGNRHKKDQTRFDSKPVIKMVCWSQVGMCWSNWQLSRLHGYANARSHLGKRQRKSTPYMAQTQHRQRNSCNLASTHWRWNEEWFLDQCGRRSYDARYTACIIPTLKRNRPAK